MNSRVSHALSCILHRKKNRGRTLNCASEAVKFLIAIVTINLIAQGSDYCQKIFLTTVLQLQPITHCMSVSNLGSQKSGYSHQHSFSPPPLALEKLFPLPPPFCSRKIYMAGMWDNINECNYLHAALLYALLPITGIYIVIMNNRTTDDYTHAFFTISDLWLNPLIMIHGAALLLAIRANPFDSGVHLVLKVLQIAQILVPARWIGIDPWWNYHH